MLRFWVLREINSRFCSKTQWQMFPLVSGRHVGAHVDEHQHGVSIQISINLEKTFLRISSIRKTAVTWILATVFVYLPSFYFQILDLIYWTVLIFYFDLPVFWMAWHWKPAIVFFNFQTFRNTRNILKIENIIRIFRSQYSVKWVYVRRGTHPEPPGRLCSIPLVVRMETVSDFISREKRGRIEILLSLRRSWLLQFCKLFLRRFALHQ